MSIYARDLRELVIRPTLHQLDEWSPSAENLLLGTAAQESGLGFRMQPDSDAMSHENRKGVGLYCLTAHTHVEVWDEFLVRYPELASRMRGLASQHQFLKSPHHELITNLSYATGIAWVVYKRHNVSLALEATPLELAHYWFTYYSIRDAKPLEVVTSVDAEPGKLLHNDAVDGFVSNYRKLVLCDNSEGNILAA